MCAKLKGLPGRRSGTRRLRPGRNPRARKPQPKTVPSRLRRSQTQSRFLQAFFDHSLDSLVLLDKHFNFIRVNEVYARACGRSVSDFPGHNHFEFYPNAENQAIFEMVVRSKRPYQVAAKPFVFPDHPEWGVTYWDWTLVPVLDADGEVDFLVFSLRDVTLRKRMESALQENEERYRSLVTATAQIVWLTDPKGEVVQELPTWQGFTGQTRAEYFGSGWTNAVHPADRARAAHAWSLAVTKRVLYQSEYRLRRHDGVYRYMMVRGVPVLEEGGAIREWVGACTDVTEQREAERRRDFTNALLGLFAQKTSSKEYLDAVVRIIREWSGCQAVGVRVMDDHLRLPYESSIGFEPTFLEAEQCLSLELDNCCCVRAVTRRIEAQDASITTPGGSFCCQDLQSFFRRLPAQQQSHFRGNCVEFGFSSLAVVPIQYRDRVIGAIHLADARPGLFPRLAVEVIESMAPLVGEAIHRFQAEMELAHYRDRLEDLVKQRTSDLEAANARLQVEIAERQRAQEVLQQTAQELERSNRDLEQFAYVASHDLQEPLRAVAGYVRLLQMRFPERMEPKALEFIAGAAEGASRMERLITDLLAFSRVGTQGGAFVVCDFKELVSQALLNLQASIQTSKAVVQTHALPSLLADPTQMVQLLQNLIGNAIKFRGARTPEIKISAQEQAARWVFSVQDNGIGIEPRYFERIFQIFQRLHTRRSYPGTGIGLAICKKIIERHGGSIWVESQPQNGSTFYFSLPAAPGISAPVV